MSDLKREKEENDEKLRNEELRNERLRNQRINDEIEPTNEDPNKRENEYPDYCDNETKMWPSSVKQNLHEVTEVRFKVFFKKIGDLL